MKFVKKIPTTDKELSRQLRSEGWVKIKEPKNLGIAILLSLPFAFILGAVTLIITYYLNPSLYDFFKNSQGFSFTIPLNLFTALFILAIFIFMSIHEFIHAMFIPDFLKSDKTFWGINGVSGFVFTTEKITKGRFLLISVMPYLLLSVILPCILAAAGWLNGYTVFLCFLNAAGACVDFLNVSLIIFQVPNGATIISNGFETYYKQ